MTLVQGLPLPFFLLQLPWNSKLERPCSRHVPTSLASLSSIDHVIGFYYHPAESPEKTGDWLLRLRKHRQFACEILYLLVVATRTSDIAILGTVARESVWAVAGTLFANKHIFILSSTISILKFHSCYKNNLLIKILIIIMSINRTISCYNYK